MGFLAVIVLLLTCRFCHRRANSRKATKPSGLKPSVAKPSTPRTTATGPALPRTATTKPPAAATWTYADEVVLPAEVPSQAASRPSTPPPPAKPPGDTRVGNGLQTPKHTSSPFKLAQWGLRRRERQQEHARVLRGTPWGTRDDSFIFDSEKSFALPRAPARRRKCVRCCEVEQLDLWWEGLEDGEVTDVLQGFWREWPADPQFFCNDDFVTFCNKKRGRRASRLGRWAKRLFVRTQ